MVDVDERVKRGFADLPIDEKALNYLDALRANRNAVSASATKSAITLVVSMGVFELLVSSHAHQVTWGPLTTRNLGPILGGLPVFVAYLQVELVMLVFHLGDLNGAHSKLMTIVQPTLAEQNLDLLLEPPGRLLMTLSSRDRDGLNRYDRVSSLVSAVFAVTLVFIVPLVFFVHAYYALFQHRPAVTSWAAVSLAIVVTLVGVAVGCVRAVIKADPDDPNAPAHRNGRPAPAD